MKEYKNVQAILFGSGCECGGTFSQIIPADAEERIEEGAGGLLSVACSGCKQQKWAYRNAEESLKETQQLGPNDPWSPCMGHPENYPVNLPDSEEFQRFHRLLARARELAKNPDAPLNKLVRSVRCRTELESYTRLAQGVMREHLKSLRGTFTVAAEDGETVASQTNRSSVMDDVDEF